MKLKEYQDRALKEVKGFLEQLVAWRKRAAENPDLEIDFAAKAWEKADVGRTYIPKHEGLGRPLPMFCLKIPTGGGKTLLAVKTIDHVQNLYLQRQTGLVVWIVPTQQIYRQTLTRLADRDDPYRQHLDMVSAGKTLILEKTDGFTPQDVEEHLCVLMLMLPSASRANKEALRMFRDSGAFYDFFPPEEANKLVVIGGDELHKEEMIRLDLHVVNKSSTNWRDTMRAAMERRDDLEEKAREYEANTNVYIRPICLVQVERTGKEQRDGRKIHAEDVREYLVGQGVAKDWIAVKSAEIDEIKDFDDIGGLLVRECPVRYIITKQALQEGWDCSFAYVLTILTNPHSKTAMTQLVGRILRQPYARKTHVPALDESYAYCFQRKDLLDEIKAGFRREGLEDMQGRIVKDGPDAEAGSLREVLAREKFSDLVANMVLPVFVIRDGQDWRLVSYEADILSPVRWQEADVSPLYKLELSLEEKRDVEMRAGLKEDLSAFARRAAEELKGGTVKFDFAYAAAHLLDVVPNPWIGYEFVDRVFDKLLVQWKDKEKVVANNLVFILEEFALCNRHAQRKSWNELVPAMRDKEISYRSFSKTSGKNG